jgi:hypothetical protein
MASINNSIRSATANPVATAQKIDAVTPLLPQNLPPEEEGPQQLNRRIVWFNTF